MYEDQKALQSNILAAIEKLITLSTLLSSSSCPPNGNLRTHELINEVMSHLHAIDSASSMISGDVEVDMLKHISNPHENNPYLMLQLRIQEIEAHLKIQEVRDTALDAMVTTIKSSLNPN